ncbi:MAG: phosphatase PAP2 family protein [Treponema sp.]|jgi:membrane-associated phospholipid phosphatase|nr:phosphatase PAP2 family protein [Treponema sp.]
MELNALAEATPLAALHQWGLEVIRALQSACPPALIAVMKGISALGTEWFYLPVIMLVFWCVDEKKGARLGLLLILSGWSTALLKGLFRMPRPYQLDPLVGRAAESSFGFPSGHALNSLVFWAAPFRWVRRKPLYALSAALLVILIGVSRLYLGVHFPTDILGGWLAGGCILSAFFAGSEIAAALLLRGGLRAQVIASAIVSWVMLMLIPGEAGLAGLMLGFGAGYAINLKWVGFKACGHIGGKRPSLLARALRFAGGAAGAALIYVSLKAILPAGEASEWYRMGRFVRYGLVGLWAAACWPLLCVRFGLAAGAAAPEDDAPEGAP